MIGNHRKETVTVAHRVDLDAMIPREDFGVLEDTYSLDLMSDFPIQHLVKRCAGSATSSEARLSARN